MKTAIYIVILGLSTVVHAPAFSQNPSFKIVNPGISNTLREKANNETTNNRPAGNSEKNKGGITKGETSKPQENENKDTAYINTMTDLKKFLNVKRFSKEDINIFDVPQTFEMLDNQKLIDKKKKELEEVTIKLKVDSRMDKGNLSDEERKEATNQFKRLQSEIYQLDYKNDSLYRIVTKADIQFETLTLKFGKYRANAFFDLVYDTKGSVVRTLNSGGFNLGDKTGSVYSELVSGNLGPIRSSFGVSVAKSSEKDSTESSEMEAFQRLSTYGGNTVLKFEYPLAYVHSQNNLYVGILRTVVKGMADLPAFGTTTDEFSGSVSLGFDFYGQASLSNNQLSFFANAYINGFSGTSSYNSLLGVPNSGFIFGQLSAGLILGTNLKISFSIVSFSSEKSLRNNKLIVGGQIVR